MTEWDWNLIGLATLIALAALAIVYGSGKRGSLICRRVVGGLGFGLYVAILIWLIYFFANVGF